MPKMDNFLNNKAVYTASVAPSRPESGSVTEGRGSEGRTYPLIESLRRATKKEL